MIAFAALRPQTYSCVTDFNGDNRKSKGAKECVIKQSNLKSINLKTKKTKIKKINVMWIVWEKIKSNSYKTMNLY